jgi:hypothetical protein
MKRIAALFLAAVIGIGAPAVAEAQGRGRDCPSGAIGKACREGREPGGDMGARARPPGRGDDGERSRPDRGGNSLGEGWRPREEDARDGVRGGRLVPLETVIRNIARSTPGQLLDAGLENRGGRPIYRVRWQTNDGRRIDYIVDAQSGQIIGRN